MECNKPMRWQWHAHSSQHWSNMTVLQRVKFTLDASPPHHLALCLSVNWRLPPDGLFFHLFLCVRTAHSCLCRRVLCQTALVPAPCRCRHARALPCASHACHVGEPHCSTCVVPTPPHASVHTTNVRPFRRMLATIVLLILAMWFYAQNHVTSCYPHPPPLKIKIFKCLL